MRKGRLLTAGALFQVCKRSCCAAMKRILSILLSAALLLSLLTACREAADGPVSADVPSEEPPEWISALEVVNAVFPRCGFDRVSADVEYLTADDDDVEFLTAYLENAYGLPAGEWEDAAVIRATGASAFELAVLRLADWEAAVQAASAFMSYIFARQGDFAGYAPAEADMVANGGIHQSGPYAALFICPDVDRAGAAFRAVMDGTTLPEPSEAGAEASEGVVPTENVLPGYDADYPDRIAFVQPNKDDMTLYDTAAIRAAWETGDTSGLSDYDRDIYAAAQTVLNEVLKKGMGDLKKETAIYKWVVNNVDYDWTHQDIMASTPRESFTPYGGLVNHKAVCLGYAATFQLLCDLAGVECITVVGAAFQSQEDHGWNMVRLDGNWYCVDATWDANYREMGMTRGRERDWDYFNVTSDDMAGSNHQWDYANTPEAVTGGKGRN